MGRDAPQVTALTLSSREENILRLLANGASDEEIAKRLDVRETWIGFLLSNIMQKLGLEDRSDLVTYATRADLGKRDQIGAPEATSGGVETEPVPERERKGEEGVVLAQESGDSGAGLVDPPVEVGPESVMGVVELIISPPLVPIQVLQLHKWLGDVVNGHLWEVHPSWRGDTVLQIDIRQLTPLVRLLDEMPLVAEVTEELYEEAEEAGEEGEQAEQAEAGREGEAAPRRLRLVLNPI